tara:strand:+ start:142 stop:786 length:645 start_codon:yes stop_codon:yes gene_type:complete
MFEILSLYVGYNENILVEDASFLFEYGKIYSISGDNGVGKTTFIKTISGLIASQGGQVSIDNKNLSSFTNQNRSSAISMLFSRNSIDTSIKVSELFEFSLGDLFYKEGFEDQRKELLKYFHVEKLYNEPFGLLSDGQKQIILLIRTFLKPARVYIFDEPAIYLDMKTKELLISYMRLSILRDKKTMLIISHDELFISKVADIHLKIENRALLEN